MKRYWLFAGNNRNGGMFDLVLITDDKNVAITIAYTEYGNHEWYHLYDMQEGEIILSQGKEDHYLDFRSID